MSRKSRGRRIAVLGSDLDGLVAALALARDGAEIILIEEGDHIGGLAAAVEIIPGYRAPLALDRGRIRGDLLRQLRLPADLLAPPPATVVASQEGLLQPTESHAAQDWLHQLDRLKGWARRIVQQPAPPLDPRDDWRAALSTGIATRSLGQRRLRMLARIASLPIADWLTESMEDGSIAAALAAPGLESTVGGPSAMGTSLQTLLRAGATGARAALGLPGLMGSLRQQLDEAGVEIRVGTPLQGLHMPDDVRVVHMESGEAIECNAVVSALPPTRLLLELLRGAEIPIAALDSLRSLRVRGHVGVVLLAIDAEPPDQLRRGGAIYQAGWSSLATLEEAADAVKYDRMAARPPVEFAVSCADDPSLAPDHGSVVTAQVRYCPTEVDSQRLIDVALEGLGAFWPTAPERVVGARAWTPGRLATEYHLPGGHLEHGEWALDQLLFLRPESLFQAGSTALGGLSLCGPGYHPGVALNGGSGWWAAGAVETRGRSNRSD